MDSTNIQRPAAARHPVEVLESRIAPAAIVFDLPVGDGAADEIVLAREGGQLVLALNGAPAAAWKFASVDSLSIGGSGDDDTLVVDFDSGEAVPAGGLFFDGRAGFDSLDLRGGSFERQISTAFDAHSGTIALDDRLITYAGIEPITDTVAAVNFVINGTATTDLIVITNGGLANGFQTILVSSGEPSTFESVRFANKQIVIVQGLGDDDTFNFNATTPAAGLVAMFLHGHSADNVGDDSAFDILSIDSSIAGVTLAATGGGGSDQFFANGGSYNRGLIFDGQAGADSVVITGVTISGATGDALVVDEMETVSISASSFTNNVNEGIAITASGAVTLTDVISTGNLVGLLAQNVASLTDTRGEYSRNDDHGLQLVNHGGNVTLNFSKLEDNDADNDNSGDGLNATSIVGDLLVRGALFRDSGPAAHQERGIFVATILATLTLTAAEGVRTEVIGHESDGVRIDNGGALATISVGSFLSNSGDGLDLRSFGTISVTNANVGDNQRGLRVENSALTVTGGTFSDNDLHGLSLAAVNVALTDVTAMNNLSRGIVADLIGSNTISGGSFSENGSHGLELRGNSVAGATLTVNGVTATLNAGDGLLVNGFTDSGNGVAEVAITGGNFNQNGAAFQSISGINLSADISDAVIDGITAMNNPLSGLRVNDAASVALINATFSANGFGATDPVGATFSNVGLLSYTPTAGAVDDTIALSASGRLTTQFTDRLSFGANVATLVLNGGEGRDTFKISPQPDLTVFVDGGAPTAAPGDVLEYNTEKRPPTQSASSITAAGVLPVNFTGIEAVSIDNNGLRLLNAKTAVFRDVDGDHVTIKLSRGALAITDFTLDPQGTGTQLQSIDFAGRAEFAGANLTLTATRDPALGGDSFASVGFVDAAGLALGNVKINGDLGRIEASGIKSLTVQSIGAFGLATQDAAATPTLRSEIIGKLGKLTVKGDIDGGVISVLGADFAAGAQATIGPIVIGGSLIGDGPFDGGSILATGGIGPVTIAGSVVGGSFVLSGAISSGGSIGAVRIGGSLVGGAGGSSGSISTGSSLGIAAHIASVSIAGNLIGGAGDLSGAIFTGSGGRIGSVTIGGSVIAGSSPDSGIQSDTTLGPVKIKGDLRGTAAAPATIAAQGILGATTAAQALAIKSVTIGGRVEHAQILAGHKTLAFPGDGLVLVGTNPDAQIGSVTAGTWIASSLAAGVSAGGDGLFGNEDDAVITGGGAALVSRIASIVIKGPVLGADAPGAHFGFIAEQIGAMKIGAARLALAPEPGDDNLAGTDPLLTFGLLRDVTVREIIA